MIQEVLMLSIEYTHKRSRVFRVELRLIALAILAIILLLRNIFAAFGFI